MRVAVELSKALPGYGHNAHVFSNGRPFGGDFKNNGVVFHSIGRKRQKGLHPAELYTDWTSDEVKAFASDLIHCIRLHRLDIIHFHYAIPFAYLAMELKRSMGQSSPLLIGTLHGTDVTQCRRDLKKKTGLATCLKVCGWANNGFRQSRKAFLRYSGACRTARSHSKLCGYVQISSC